MIAQVTYTEDELCEVFKCGRRRIYEMREMGILHGTKIGKGYVYHNNEITRLFEKYEGKDVPSKKRSYQTHDSSITHKNNHLNYIKKG